MTTTNPLQTVLGPGTKHLEALQRRHQSYAIHFVLDCGMDGYPPANAEPTDENLALALRNCARTPRADEYPAIRMHVDTYRMAQMSSADALRDVLTAARATLPALILLGDFIGNTFAGKTGIPAFDRCAVILALREAIAEAEGTPRGVPLNHS